MLEEKDDVALEGADLTHAVDLVRVKGEGEGER